MSAAILSALAGLLFGWGYFVLLRHSADMTATGAWRVLLSGSLTRIVMAAVFLGTLAQFGAVALLSAFAGFLVIRTLAAYAPREAL